MSKIQELLDVAVQLDEWIDGRCGDNGPVAIVTYAPNGADAIEIGDDLVYCSESSSFEPTFENCRNEFLRQMHQRYSAFWEEADNLATRELMAEIEKD